jgi:hypothetical protein
MYIRFMDEPWHDARLDDATHHQSQDYRPTVGSLIVQVMHSGLKIQIPLEKVT